jgi:hypothetical protein
MEADYITLPKGPDGGRLGTTAEGLKNPRREVLAIVEYLGSRGKVFQIRMRNIRGGPGDFQEAYPDEGERILRGGPTIPVCCSPMPSGTAILRR